MWHKLTDDEYCFSPQQLHLWKLMQIGGPDHYRTRGTIEIHGNLDIQRLKDAYLRIISQHDVFHAVLSHSSQIPIMHHAMVPVSSLWNEPYDVSNMTVSEKERQIEMLRYQINTLSFDFEKGPLLHAHLIKVTPLVHLLYLEASSLCADSTTLNWFVQKLSHYYTSAQEADRLEDTLSYADLATWQNELLEAQDTQAARMYWHQGREEDKQIELPLEKRSITRREFAPCSLRFTPDNDMRNALIEMGQIYDISTIMVCCWNILLSRFLDGQAFSIGIAYDGRHHEELKDQPGLFTRYLPYHCLLNNDMTFMSLLEQTTRSTQEMLEWQEYFDWEGNGDLSNVDEQSFYPSFVAEYVYIKTVRIETAQGEIQFSLRNPQSYCEQFKLGLSCKQEDQSLFVDFLYDETFYTEEGVRCLVNQFHTLLINALRNPETTVGKLPLQNQAERHHILVDLNETKVVFPNVNNLVELFEEQVKHRPDALAVMYGDEQISFGELNNRVNQVAFYLRQQGIGPDMLVGIYMERSVEMVIAMLAILKSDGCYLPLEPSYPKERLLTLLEDSRTRVVLTSFRKEDRRKLLYDVQTIDLVRDWPLIAQQPTSNPKNHTFPQNLAYVIYTSGSTGRPKGVMITHSAICNHMLWMRENLCWTEIDHILQKTPFSFDASVWEFYMPLITGALLVMMPDDLHLETDSLRQVMQQYAVTVLQVVPSLLNMLLEDGVLAEASYLKQVFCGGEELSLALQDAFFAQCSASLHNLYGPTETTIDTTWWTSKNQFALRYVPIGRPIANAEVYVLDEQMLPVPVGMPGELYIGGAGLARGYILRPEQTAEQFLPHPFSSIPGARLYRTGDIVRLLPDNFIVFLRRDDRLVKLRGHRIELGEIEAQLNSYGAVKQTAVLVKDITGSESLVAFVVPQKAQMLTANELHLYLQDKIPRYMVPSFFVIIDSLPLSHNGKIDWATLLTLQTHQNAMKEYVPSATHSERTLENIWTEVLGIERIGICDNFFEIGGDSIVALRIVAKAKQAGLQFTLKQLFEHPTIVELAALAVVSSSPTSEQSEVRGQIVLTPIQHWFFEHHLEELHHFNQCIFLETNQPLDPVLLKKTILALLTHHDALRIQFAPYDEGWKAMNMGVDQDWQFVFHIENLSTLSEQDQWNETLSRATQFQASFNLSKGLLLRCVLFHYGQSKSDALLIIIHHLIVDEVSWHILLEDFQTAYQQLLRSEEVHLPLKTASFQQWATHLQEYACSSTLQQEITYWQNQQDVHFRLPRDKVEGSNIIRSACTYSNSLTIPETHALVHELPIIYRTESVHVLLAALVHTLANWTGFSSIPVHLEGHGREDVIKNLDVSRTVGWFTTIFPMLFNIAHNEPLTILRLVKEQLRQVPNHGIGYGLLRYLCAEPYAHTLRTSYQTEVIFNYLGQLNTSSSMSPFSHPSDRPCGTLRGLQQQRCYLLEIDAEVVEEQLCISWTYSKNIHDVATIEKLATDYLDTLRFIINSRATTGTEVYTPSDFPHASIDQEELSTLLDKLQKSKGRELK